MLHAGSCSLSPTKEEEKKQLWCLKICEWCWINFLRGYAALKIIIMNTLEKHGQIKFK